MRAGKNIVLGAAISMAVLCGAAKAQDLTVGVGSEATSLDPHFYPITANVEIARHIFDSLITYDRTRNVVAGLATSWRRVDDLTWEFKLRDGVRFSNGQPLTADDVVFTFDRVPKVTGSPSNYEQYTKHFVAVEKSDDLTVRFRTRVPHPGALSDIIAVPIITKSIDDAVETKDFNEGRAAIGTGPYKLESWKRSDRITLVRSDTYWGQAPHWKTVTFRPLTNSAARTAALLTGAVDIINQLPSADVGRFRSDKNLQVVAIPGNRLIHFMIDQASDKPKFIRDAEGKPLDVNPLKDPRVRHALSKAINREALVERVMDGLAVKADQLMADIYVGKNAKIVPDRFDLAGARALLAEAGYPNGFSMTIHGTNNRYLNDEKVVQTVAQMLTRIGLKVNVETLPAATYFGNAAKPAYDYFLVGLSAPGLYEYARSLIVTRDAKAGYGPYNWGGIHDARIDDLFGQATREIDDGKRDAILKDAEAYALNDLHVVTPLFFEMNIWAVKKGLSFDGRFDGETYAADVRPD